MSGPEGRAGDSPASSPRSVVARPRWAPVTSAGPALVLIHRFSLVLPSRTHSSASGSLEAAGPEPTPLVPPPPNRPKVSRSLKVLTRGCDVGIASLLGFGAPCKGPRREQWSPEVESPSWLPRVPSGGSSQQRPGPCGDCRPQ